MKLLKDILYGCRIVEVKGNTNIAIEQINFDSRKVGKLHCFVAIAGTVSDGHHYIESAIEKGAIAVVCEEFPDQLAEGITYVKVQDSSRALGNMASNFFDNPSEDLRIVGVTGTNGKTTIASLLYELFLQLGYKVGLVSTVENKINRVVKPSTHTTPDAISLQQLLSEMREAGCRFVFMEVSSHAVDQNRVAGITFTGGIFTNISHDHLDYHKTFSNYIAAKKAFFDMLPADAFAISNLDDANGTVMLQNTKARKRYYAVKRPCDYKVKVIENLLTGLQLEINHQEIHCRLIGKFNAYNIAAIYAAALELGQDSLQVLTAISLLGPVAGRFQYIKTPGGITVIIDYAHTPDALENVLKTLNDTRTKTEKIITVIGCGGDRDKTKRPEMAKVATELSDRVVFTSDNPRTENPTAILNDMKAGVEPQHFMKYTVIEDRAEAIKQAIQEANKEDVVLVAGKGHETYQEINGVKHPFDDAEVVKQTLNLLKK
ncbi:UDP-N-acetylmuramoyl-L-alanyl-D-glutamate--2,6-diaminopimelate ligase [Luteibaculum oceani]|uniref:UDP-N-acetylmuramoyl-L-alanyl-D-glutamate--2,6-diaminopimelate ligase n=1 Tax=Luteibaculum oceani TaxID=1294296 RepID=A0A5C6V511_9FLAO|nr:UDP-N-acetylmuramoyl-L-alanyl-D-glutamate--2,6-diaminopimelate ligase [Luteibaculum oceani]TXC78878.1 UDP-N-acetylmuramoyl-L-alanyl-D-glutamate--2,6-diaminopimelate ligase [Luteibaculum oceani]